MKGLLIKVVILNVFTSKKTVQTEKKNVLRIEPPYNKTQK